MSLRGKITGIGLSAAVVAATAIMAGGTAASAASGYSPPKRVLREGSSGADVRALQQRLAALKYYPGGADGHFGANTLEAVWAFQEVNRLPVSGDVGNRTKADLVHPHAYRSNDPRQDGTRVEVNLGLGVLVLYVNHQIALVTHESSGGHYTYDGDAYARTPTGKFRTLRFIPGWHHAALGYMYNPVYFNDSGYAIHGDTSVPKEPASHGCVRVPMFIANWFHRDVRLGPHGTEVWIYNQW